MRGRNAIWTQLHTIVFAFSAIRMIGIRYFNEQHTRTVALVIFASVACKLIFGKCNRRGIRHCTGIYFNWNGFELKILGSWWNGTTTSKLTGNYQGFWLIVTLRLQEYVNCCLCWFIRDLLIEVTQKFDGQKIVILLTIFGRFQSLEKGVPVEWPPLTLGDLSFCRSAI